MGNPINIYDEKESKNKLNYIVGNKIFKATFLETETGALRRAVNFANCRLLDSPINIIEYKVVN
ncbi:MAG: hypothetical protein MJ231_08735 [bacterium]|nr:hypothetical protein [bacterium]